MKVAVTKMQSAKKSFTPMEIMGAYSILIGIQKFNGALAGTVAQWVHKNLKVFARNGEKCGITDQSIIDKYVNPDEEGKIPLWNGREPVICAYKTANGTILSPEGEELPRAGNYFPFIENEEERKKYQEEKLAFNQTPIEMQIQQIQPDLIEKLDIPTRFNGQEVDLGLLYDNLVIGEDETDGKEEN